MLGINPVAQACDKRSDEAVDVDEPEEPRGAPDSLTPNRWRQTSCIHW